MLTAIGFSIFPTCVMVNIKSIFFCVHFDRIFTMIEKWKWFIDISICIGYNNYYEFNALLLFHNTNLISRTSPNEVYSLNLNILFDSDTFFQTGCDKYINIFPYKRGRVSILGYHHFILSRWCNVFWFCWNRFLTILYLLYCYYYVHSAGLYK